VTSDSTSAPLPRVDVHLTGAEAEQAMRSDALAGLTASPKTLPPKWLYDDRGSALFDDITRLPEYYPTRAEREILATYGVLIAKASGATSLVELGSGTCDKTRVLLDAMQAAGTLEQYIGFDISEATLRDALASLASQYRDTEILGVVGDFEHHIDRLPSGGPRLVAFLGGTIGNLLPHERARFFASVAAVLQPGDGLLLGADIVKDPGRIVAAYDDAAGVTSDFNRNVLLALNHRLDADFDHDAFEHVARWDTDNEWIEMRLRANVPQQVTIGGLGLTVDFAAGEELRTEISAKFRREGLEAELAAAGFEPFDWWTDRAGDFALTMAFL
jgi:L-histidine N-alpha-methyltransferase